MASAVVSLALLVLLLFTQVVWGAEKLSPSAIQYAFAAMSLKQIGLSCATEADCSASAPRCIQIVTSGFKTPICLNPQPDGSYCDDDGDCGGGNGAIKRKCEAYTASKCNQSTKESGKCCVAILDGGGATGNVGSDATTSSPIITSTTGSPSIGSTTRVSGTGEASSGKSSGSTTRSSDSGGPTGGSGGKSSMMVIVGAGLFDAYEGNTDPT
jgi:hypothetical protein